MFEWFKEFLFINIFEWENSSQTKDDSKQYNSDIHKSAQKSNPFLDVTNPLFYYYILFW